MVQAGGFELRLVGSDGRPFPEVTSGGRTFAVAAPGASFEVEVVRLPHVMLPPKGIFHCANLLVDGQNVGFTKNMRDNYPRTRFEGFLKAGDAQGTAVQAFVFAKPRESAAKQANSLNFVEGTIKAEVHYVQVTGESTEHKRHHGPAAANTTIASLGEGKKFFLAPSLTTGKGELKMLPGFSTQSFHRLPGPALATLELRYETAATLLLRGVLKRDNPQHRAILQQFPETAGEVNPESQAAEEEEEEEESAAGPSHRGRAAGAAGAAGGGGRGKRRRQREQGDEEEELIDLTKAPAEGDEVLAAKAQDKTLVCDLTAEEQPKWKAVKREVHHVV